MPHSKLKTIETPNAYVVALPIFHDNYSYLLIDKKTSETALVDPADFRAVRNYLPEVGRMLGRDLKTKLILTTHHHFDHSGGNQAFRDLCPSLEVISGCENVDVEGATRVMNDGDQLTFGSLTVQARMVPAHTMGSLLFIEHRENVCFSGDFLFSAGCGKFFEGGAEDFYQSINKSFADLPGSMLLCPGHEYTQSNLGFALHILPENAALQARMKQAQTLRESSSPTIPNTLENERLTNLFLRCCLEDVDVSDLAEAVRTLVASQGQAVTVSHGSDQDCDVRAGLESNDRIGVVRALRALKDSL